MNDSHNPPYLHCISCTFFDTHFSFSSTSTVDCYLHLTHSKPSLFFFVHVLVVGLMFCGVGTRLKSVVTTRSIDELDTLNTDLNI